MKKLILLLSVLTICQATAFADLTVPDLTNIVFNQISSPEPAIGFPMAPPPFDPDPPGMGTVPEPASLLLLATGMFGLGLLSRKWKK